LSVVLTSIHTRHKYYAKMLCEKSQIDLVVFERKNQEDYLTSEEIKYFGDLRSWNPSCKFIVCEKGEINNGYIEEEIKKVNPAVCFVFGTSILKENIFNIPKFGCVNIHTGKTQYYRGVDSAFWSIFEENLDGIGATIHSINKGIDTGDVIYQATPSIEIDDNYISLFLKSCHCGFKTVIKNIDSIISGNYLSISKSLDRGRLFVSKDKTSEKELKVSEKTARVIGEYLSVKN